jgi:hypothetical protein
MPAGPLPGGAVSPEGRFSAFGAGALRVLRTVQSDVRAIAIVLSRLAESSLLGVGKAREVTVLA